MEGEEERERELERKLKHGRSLGGKGTVDAPLDLGGDHAQASPPAGTAFAHHSLYDVHGGGAPARYRGKQTAKVTKNGVREEAGGGGGGRGDVAAAAAGGMNIDSLVANSCEPTRPDRASGKRSNKKSACDARPMAAKTPLAKKVNDGGSGSGAAPGDGPKNSASPVRRYRILSCNQLPPGWKITRIEQPDKHVSSFLSRTTRETGWRQQFGGCVCLL